MIDRDSIIEFIETRKRTLLILVAAFVCVLLIVFLVSLVSLDVKKKKLIQISRELRSHALTPQELWLPEEPFQIPSVQYFREARSVWSAEDAKEWYTMPSASSLGDLRSVGKMRIDGLLESVP